MRNDSVLPAVYIVLNLESSGEDIIWDVCSTEELAKVSENNLKQQRVGGALTKIVYYRISGFEQVIGLNDYEISE